MEINKKILVVDDQKDLREQLAKLLGAGNLKNEYESLADKIRKRLIGESEEDTENLDLEGEYQVDTAAQGQEALKKLVKSIEKNEPYALVFLDMRMPPGWDGMETAKRMRELDENVEIVIMTAYADYDQKEIAETVGSPEKLLYIKKPFQMEEIFQLALSLTTKWSFEASEQKRKKWLESLVRNMGRIKSFGTNELDKIYLASLEAFGSFTESKKGFIAQFDEFDKKWKSIKSHNMKNPECEEFIKENSSILDESRTTQKKNNFLLLPVKRKNFSSVFVLYDVVKQVDPEWYQLLNLLVMTTGEVINNALTVQNSLEQERLSAVGTAAGKISHEMKNYLSCMKSFSVQLKEISHNESVTEYLDDIQYYTDKMLNQIKNVMTFSRNVPELEKDKFNLKNFLEDSFKTFKLQNSDKKINFSLESSDDNLELNADLSLLESVFRNLYLNSLDAFDFADSNELEIKIEIKKESGKIFLKFMDNGPGVSEKIITEIFAPFVSAGNKSGFGLGLPIVKQYLEANDASIEYDKTYKDGACFLIVFKI